MADEKVVIELILDDKDFKKVVNTLPGKFEAAGKKSGKSYSAALSRAIKDGLSNLNKSIGNLITNSAKLTTAGLAVGAAFTFKSAVSEAATFEKSLRGLNSIAGAFGVNTKELSGIIQELEAEGLVPLNDITESFKNLIRSTGGDLDVATKAFRAFRDSATNNRQGQLALGESIVRTTQGIRNQISNLTDSSGVTENLSQVNAKYAKSIGTTVNKLTEQEKQLGSVIGLTKAAAISTGDFLVSLNNFDGIIGSIGAEFTKFLRQLGQFVTQSPTVLQVLKIVGKEFKELNKSFVEFGSSGGIKSVTLSALDLGKSIVNFVLKPISAVVDIFDIFRNAGAFAIQSIIVSFTELGGIIAKVFKSLGIENSLLDTLEGTAEVARGALFEIEENLGQSIDNAFSFDRLEQVINFTESLKEQIDSVNEVVKTTATTLGEVAKETDKSWISIVKTATNSGKAISNAIKNALVKSASAGIQSLTKSLLLGQDGFSNFGKVIAGILGDMAVQLGETLLLTGTGMQALTDLSGATAIIAGAGLIALGTILKSFSGGGGTSPSAGTVGGNFTQDQTSGIGEDEPVERQEQQPGITVNIRGDVLDSNESGSRLVKIINDAYDQEGVVINRGAIA